MKNNSIQIDLKKTDSVHCKVCKCEIFERVFYLRSLSALLSPTGKKEMIPIEVFQCEHCKTVLEFAETNGKT